MERPKTSRIAKEEFASQRQNLESKLRVLEAKRRVSGRYRIDYYDEFNNETKTAYLFRPLSAYRNDEFLPLDPPVPMKNVVRDYHDERD